MTRLSEYVCRVSDDPAKTDLELIHEPCGEHLCDVEHGDSIDVLVTVCNEHYCAETA